MFFVFIYLWMIFLDGLEIDNDYVVSENGLYPCIYRPNSSKQMEVRIKKFEFFGRLLAQALMDSRMVYF